MYLYKERQMELLNIVKQMKSNFSTQPEYYKLYGAILAMDKKNFDVEKVKETLAYIKKNTSLFSSIRQHAFFIALVLTMYYKKPEQAFNRLSKHIDIFKEKGMKKSDYLPMAALTLDIMLFDDSIQDMSIQTNSYRTDLIERAAKVLEEMKVHHPWITGGDDYPLAVLIAHGNKELGRMENIYSLLSEKGLHKGNSLQSLANIISLSDLEEEILTEQIMEIIEKCKESGFKIRSNMYPGIGLIALIEKDEEHLKEIISVANALKSIKYFKWVDKSLLFMYAVSLISNEVKKDLSQKTVMETTISTTIEQLIMAQTAVMSATLGVYS